jgi:hypothetical protein
MAGAGVEVRRVLSLADRDELSDGRVFLTGVQALVCVLLDQRRANERAGAADRDVRVRLSGLARPTELGVVRTPFFCSGCRTTRARSPIRRSSARASGATRW